MVITVVVIDQCGVFPLQQIVIGMVVETHLEGPALRFVSQQSFSWSSCVWAVSLLNVSWKSDLIWHCPFCYKRDVDGPRVRENDWSNNQKIDVQSNHTMYSATDCGATQWVTMKIEVDSEREKKCVRGYSFKIGTAMTDYQNGRIRWIWKIAEMNETDFRTEQQWQCVASRATHGHRSDHQEDGQFGNESISVSVNSFTLYFERNAEQIKVSWPISENKSVRGLFQLKWEQQWRSEGKEHRVCTVKWSRNEHQEVKCQSHGYRGTLSRSSLIIPSVFGPIPFAADIILELWLPEITWDCQWSLWGYH